MDRNATDLYLKQVKKELRCSAKQKRALVQPLSQALQEFAQENGAVTIEQVTAAFGTPQKQAEDLMETLDATEIKKAFIWKHAVVIGVLAIVLIWFVAILIMWIDGHTQIHGRGVETIGDSIISIEEY